MAEFIVRNNLNPNKAVKCTITFRQIVNKNEEGEPKWMVEIATAEPHKDGGPILPVFVHYTDAANLDAAVSEAVATLSEQVDWSPLVLDVKPPYLEYHIPDNNEVVDIDTNFSAKIVDDVPAAGVDIDSITMTINGVDVTDEIVITGSPLSYNVVWRPPLRVYDYE